MYNNSNMNEIKVGDKLIIKDKDNLPSPIDESIKTLDTEITIDHVNPGGYVTLSYETTKEFSVNENDGQKIVKINFMTSNVNEFFKLKK